MRVFKVCVVIFLFAFSVSAVARVEASKFLNEAQLKLVKKQLNSKEFYFDEAYARGKLSDGQDYLAINYLTQEDVEYNDKQFSDEQLFINRCAIFKQNKGVWQKVAVSPLFRIGGVRSTFSCMVYKSNLVVDVSDSSGSSWGSTIYKFDHHLNLVGVDRYALLANSKDEGTVFTETINSVNLLTKKAIFSAKQGRKLKEWAESDMPSILIGRVVKPYKYREFSKAFGEPIHFTYSNFDEEKYGKWVELNEWEGYWDENLKFKCGHYDKDINFVACKPK